MKRVGEEGVSWGESRGRRRREKGRKSGNLIRHENGSERESKKKRAED